MDNKEKYIDRLVDKKIKDYLTIFGAVNVEGPKWCGKLGLVCIKPKQ